MANDNDHTDRTEHSFVIKKDVFVEFEASVGKRPKNLVVIYKGKPVDVKANGPDNAQTLTRRWTLDNEIFVAPDCEDSVTFRVTYTKVKKKGLRGFFKTRKDEAMEITLGYNIISWEVKEQNETKISVTKDSCTVSLEVARNDIYSNIVDAAVDDLMPVLPDSFQDIIASCTNDTFLQDIKLLSNILESIPVSGDVLQAIERAVTTIAEAHPLAKAVLTALSIPYKLIKNAKEFTDNVKDLANTMRFTCSLVMDPRYHTKIASAKEQLTSIMETLRDAALCVNKYVGRGEIGQFIGAQFPAELEGYAEALIEQKNEFQMAMIIRVARDTDMNASMTVEDFLRKHLDPVKDDERLSGCLEGTRTIILEEIRDWIQTRDDTMDPNILWLVGPPGAGKSTIAATIAKELADKPPFCVMFSCRRDVPNLRDPRRIWPTIAFGLADKHAGMKAALMATVNEKKNTFRYDSVVEQFEKLVRSPLDTDWTERHFLSRKQAYPVIIIDALDECNTADDDWDSLLESLAKWSALCEAGVVKLIVMSRDLVDIRRTLDEVSLRIDLTTGGDASPDSKSDVRVFFKSKFTSMRVNSHSKPHDSHPDWPGEQVIDKLTDYAAGLFVWADMVVKYIASRAGASGPSERLRAVLSDVETAAGIDGASRVDRLYAGVVFEALQHSHPAERVLQKSVLATVLLAKQPLGIDDLVELLSTDGWNARNATESTLQALSAIIPTDNVDNRLRVCHKAVSDFLLSPSRSKAAMEYVVKQWEKHRPTDQAFDPVSFTINPEEEEKNLALSCMHLLHRKFTEDTDNVEKHPNRSSKSLDYAIDHWFEHLEGAPAGRMAPADLESLVNAMKVAFGCLKQRIGVLILVKEETSALITSLRGAATLAIRCRGGSGHDGLVGQPDVEDLWREVAKYTKNLDVVRGTFQIAMIENLTSEASDSFLRKRLQPADQTVFDHPCLKGTRTSILNRAKEWMEDIDTPNILWIVGGPGAGKSAIATSLVGDFSEGAGRLCAKVFAKRDFVDRRDPTRIWRTLTYDVASSGFHCGLKGSITEKLFEKSEGSYDILTDALRDQQHLSAVFIIDALDECLTEDNGRALLQALAGWADLPRSLKLVVTSRDLPEIRGALADVSISISLKADSEESKKEAESDLDIFLHTKLQEVLKESDDAFLYWTQPDVVYQVVEHAAESFIWARMFVELVNHKPDSHLDDILKFNNSGSDGNVDVLYAKLLFEVLGPLHHKERERFRTVLAFVAFAKTALREADLVDLLGALRCLSFTDETHTPVANIVKEWSSVVSIGDNGLLRIPHKSFVDFLLDGDHYGDGERDSHSNLDSRNDVDGGNYSDGDCGNNNNNNSDHDTDCDIQRQSVSQPIRGHHRSLSAMERLLPSGYDPRLFIVNREEDSEQITIACLQLMNNALKFNLCGIETSHVLNDGIPGLEARISEDIKMSLIYACRFWAEHLNDCRRDNLELRGQLESLLKKLLDNKFLYWLEILSLAKAVPSAKRSLQFTEVFLEGYDSESAEVAKDARRFVEMFEKPIAAAVPHIYVSALPFCPSHSWIARTYGPRYRNVVSVIKGLRMEWDRDAYATTSDAHTDSVRSIAFFPDGRKLASGSDDKTVRIWDAKTGEARSVPFTGHENWVRSVVVSPDGSQVASGDWDGVLRIWDGITGACPLGSINAHSSSINSVVFSPDGSRIVTGSNDETVKVWNVLTGDLCVGPLAGHMYGVNSVAFSTDATVIAAGSLDIIRIWDAHTGKSCREPLMGHTLWILCVAFSPDGRYLASGSYDKSIRLWDVKQGFSLTSTVTVGSAICSVSFSPDSNRLVSGSNDGALRFWNVRSGTIEQIGNTIYGHTEYVTSVAFSPDGQTVASGIGGHSVKIWNVSSSSAQHPGTAMIREGILNSVYFDPESLDSGGYPVLDDAFIDDDGWMVSSRRDGAAVLFWVPEENRGEMWWPRNIAVIHPCATKFSFGRFRHGENWTECRTSMET